MVIENYIIFNDVFQFHTRTESRDVYNDKIKNKFIVNKTCNFSWT